MDASGSGVSSNSRHIQPSPPLQVQALIHPQPAELGDLQERPVSMSPGASPPNMARYTDSVSDGKDSLVERKVTPTQSAVVRAPLFSNCLNRIDTCSSERLDQPSKISDPVTDQGLYPTQRPDKPPELTISQTSFKQIVDKMQQKLEEESRIAEQQLNNAKLQAGSFFSRSYMIRKYQKKISKLKIAQNKFRKIYDLAHSAEITQEGFYGKKSAAKISLLFKAFAKHTVVGKEFLHLARLLKLHFKVDYMKQAEQEELEKMRRFWLPLEHRSGSFQKSGNIDIDFNLGSNITGADKGVDIAPGVYFTGYHQTGPDDADLIFDIKSGNMGVKAGAGISYDISGSTNIKNGARVGGALRGWVELGKFDEWDSMDHYCKAKAAKNSSASRASEVSNSKIRRYLVDTLGRLIPQRPFSEIKKIKAVEQKSLDATKMTNDLLANYLALPDIKINPPKYPNPLRIESWFLGYGGVVNANQGLATNVGNERGGIKLGSGASQTYNWFTVDAIQYANFPYSTILQFAPQKLRELPESFTKQLRQYLGVPEGKKILIKGISPNAYRYNPKKLTKEEKKWIDKRSHHKPFKRKISNHDAMNNENRVLSKFDERYWVDFAINNDAVNADLTRTCEYTSLLDQQLSEYQDTVRQYDYQKKAGKYKNKTELKRLRKLKHQIEASYECVGRHDLYAKMAASMAFCLNILCPAGKWEDCLTSEQRELAESLLKKIEDDCTKPWTAHYKPKLEPITAFRERAYLIYEFKTGEFAINVGSLVNAKAYVTTTNNKHPNPTRSGLYVDVVLHLGVGTSLQSLTNGAKWEITQKINDAIVAHGGESISKAEMSEVVATLSPDIGGSIAREYSWRFFKPRYRQDPKYKGNKGFVYQNLRRRTEEKTHIGDTASGIPIVEGVSASVSAVHHTRRLVQLLKNETLGTKDLTYSHSFYNQYRVVYGDKNNFMWNRFYATHRKGYQEIFKNWAEPNSDIAKDVEYFFDNTIIPAAQSNLYPSGPQSLDAALQLKEKIKQAMANYASNSSISNEAECRRQMEAYFDARWAPWKDAFYSQIEPQVYKTSKIFKRHNLATRILKKLGRHKRINSYKS